MMSKSITVATLLAAALALSSIAGTAAAAAGGAQNQYPGGQNQYPGGQNQYPSDQNQVPGSKPWLCQVSTVSHLAPFNVVVRARTMQEAIERAAARAGDGARVHGCVNANQHSP